jgi:alkylhydroperoxidase/carboxymuconolactone decarboxylase family protein YurZ
MNINESGNDYAKTALPDRLPEVTIGYEQFTGEVFDAGELDAMTKHLIGLGVALFANNENSIHYYLQAVRDLGGTDLQIMETAAISSAASGHIRLQAGMSIPGWSPISPSY